MKLYFTANFIIDYKNRKCKWSRELRGWEVASGQKQIITKPTRIDKSSASVIDLCFTNVQHIDKSGVIDINISDHFPTFFIKKKGREIKTSCSFTGRNYSELSVERVEEALSSFNIEQDEPSLCPNDTWTNMQTAFECAADIVCPKKIFRIKHDKPSYFSDALRKAMNERDRLYRIARSGKTDANWF